MTEQLALFNLAPTQVIKTVTDPYWDEIIKSAPQHSEQVSCTTGLDTVNTCVGEQVTTDTLKPAPQHDKSEKVAHWVEKYWVERSGSKHWYYRYMWMSGRKIQRVYIGSVHSPKAQAKKQAVEIAIADGETPQEIQKIIRAS
jgi:hypothetical protein